MLVCRHGGDLGEVCGRKEHEEFVFECREKHVRSESLRDFLLPFARWGRDCPGETRQSDITERTEMASGSSKLWISWRDEAFGVVTIANCLSYFARSPFVELQSPTVRNNKLVSSSAGADERDDVEYVVQDAQPPNLFVIRMQARGVPIALFYILETVIYACPSLHHVLASRQKRAGYKIHRSLDLLRHDLNPVDGVLSNRDVDMKEAISRLEAAVLNLDSSSGKKKKPDYKGDAILAQFIYY